MQAWLVASARRAMEAPQLPPQQHRLEQSEETSRSGAPAHRRRAMAAAAPPPPRWLTVAATLGFAALHLGSQRGGARAQVFDWNGISVKQYEAQLAYESWQKDDTTASGPTRTGTSSATTTCRASWPRSTTVSTRATRSSC